MFNWLAGEMPVTSPDHVAVLGLGLIGGSLLRRLAELGTAVTGYDADPAARATAITTLADAASTWPTAAPGLASVAQPAGLGQAGVADSVAAAVAGADLVVLAVPLPAAGPVLDELAAAGYTGLLTDVTSVKGPPRELAAARCPGARWVGGHPMAGREASGFAASDPALFDGCAWVLCLEPETALDDWLRLAALVIALGARAVPATADDHDAAVARISHAPHVVAAALVTVAAAGDPGPLALALGAGSFRDGTRVAATRPALTAAMCGGNAAALRSALDSLLDQLGEARRLLDAPDPVAALETWFAPAHAVRSAWPATPGSAEQVPAERAELLALGRAGGWITAVDAPNT
jgi:prephenate dehydrogenase